MKKISIAIFLLVVNFSLIADLKEFKTIHLTGKLDPPSYVLQITERRILNSGLPFYKFEKIKEYTQPSKKWFLEGLFLYKNSLFESAGLFGKSSLIKLNLRNMKIQNKKELPSKYFGEDITILNGKLYQLTYKSHECLIYNPNTLKLIGHFGYESEGWGLTNNGKYLIKSDGSQYIYFLDPKANYSVVKTITVKDKYGDIKMLNSLDYMNGNIYANIYLTPYTAIISPGNGNIIGWISLKGLGDKYYSFNKHHVPNGITHNNKNNLFVGGKFFPRIYQINLKKAK